MNRERRKRIADVQEKIAGLLEELDEIRTEEEEAYAQRREKMYRLVTMLARAYAAFKPRMAEARAS